MDAEIPLAETYTGSFGTAPVDLGRYDDLIGELKPWSPTKRPSTIAVYSAPSPPHQLPPSLFPRSPTHHGARATARGQNLALSTSTGPGTANPSPPRPVPVLVRQSPLRRTSHGQSRHRTTAPPLRESRCLGRVAGSARSPGQPAGGRYEGQAADAGIARKTAPASGSASARGSPGAWRCTARLGARRRRSR